MIFLYHKILLASLRRWRSLCMRCLRRSLWNWVCNNHYHPILLFSCFRSLFYNILQYFFFVIFPKYLIFLSYVIYVTFYLMLLYVGHFYICAICFYYLPCRVYDIYYSIQKVFFLDYLSFFSIWSLNYIIRILTDASSYCVILRLLLGVSSTFGYHSA